MKYTMLYLKYLVIVILLLIAVVSATLGVLCVAMGVFGAALELDASLLVLLPVGVFCGFMGFAAFDCFKLLIDKWELGKV
jgi:hypothetical protein